MGKVPKLRFDGFEGDWDQHKLVDISDIVTGTTPSTREIDNYNGDRLFVSPADIQGNRYVDNTITTLSEKGFSLGRKLRPGATLFVSIGSTIGKVAQTRKMATTNQQINAVVPYNFMDDDFTYSLLEKESDTIRRLSAQQAVPIVNKTTFGNVEIICPNKAEQHKIGSLLSALDRLLDLNQRKRDALLKAKQFYLQNLFPRKGEKTPRLRFEGFSGEWVLTKIANICLVAPFKPYLAEANCVGKYEVIQQGEKPVLGYADGIPYMNYEKVTLFGDHTLSLYKASAPFFVASDGLKILYSSHVTGKMFYYLLEKYKPESEGYKRHFTILKERECLYPILVEEQKAIGDFLTNLDHLITTQQRKLETLKRLKQFLLQNLFV